MEIVDLSIDDPEIKIKNDKKLRKKFNELKKYVPFLKYIFELDPDRYAQYKTLIDWLKIRNHSTLDHWHVISCESTIKRRYEKLKKAMNFPTHITEIFEGGISIVISDEEDPPSNSKKFKEEEPLTHNNEQNNNNVNTEQQSSTSSIETVQRLESNEAHTESREKDETLSTRGKKELSLSARRTSSSSKISSKRRSSKYGKESIKSKNDTNQPKTVDASVFDIVSWNDLEKEDETSPVLEKETPSRAIPPPSESVIRKKKKYKHSPKKTDKYSKKIELQSYESLMKKKKEILKKLKDDDKKIKPSNIADNCILEKPKEIELFQRRESTRSERRKSFVDLSIIDSVKCVLNKNPKIIAEVVNDSLGTKIVYDYTNVTKMSFSKTIPVRNTVIKKPAFNIHHLRTEISKTRDIDCIKRRNVNDIEIITSKTPEANNNYTSGDAYRKAMHEQQTNLQFQESLKESQSTLLHRQDKMNYNSSVNSKSQNHDVSHDNMQSSKKDVLGHSSNNNKKGQQLTDSTQQRLLNSKSSSRTHTDRRRTSEKQSKSQSTDVDINIKSLHSSEDRGKSTERKTKQINSTATFAPVSNSSGSKQKEKEENEVVLMSFPRRCTFINRIDSESSLEDFEPDKTNFVSKAKQFPIKSKADETSKHSEDGCRKSSKTKPSSVSDPKESKMPILFKKDEPRKNSERKTLKPNQDSSLIRKLESAVADVSSKIDHKTTKPKNDSNKNPIVDLTSNEKKSKFESRNNVGKTQKRKNSAHQEHDLCKKQKLLKIDNIKKISDKVINDHSHIDLAKTSERQKVKNKNNSKISTDKTIKEKSQKNLKSKNSKESTKKSNKPTENKTKISTQPVKEHIQTPTKTTNFPAVASNLKLSSDCLDISKGDESKQREVKSKDSSNKSTHNTTKLKENSRTVEKCLKRNTSVECTKEPNNQPLKKSKIPEKAIKVPTPKKTTNSPAKRFYRELNNLTCTFKESLLPQTIGRRRCSSSWLNLTENVNRKPRSITADLTPAPIQRRRQTCSAMPNLKLTLQRSSDHSDEYHIKGVQTDRSSNETDEIDKDDQCGRNTETSNPDITERGVESNTNTDTNISVKTMKSPLKEMPRLIPFDSMQIQTPSNKPPGNNDSKMTFKSTKTCVLCNKNSIDLTNHYVVKHKTESYVSRLSSADIYRLEKEKNVAISVCRNRYRITCVFCKQMIEDHFENFHAHFSFHTGEYNFECEGCKIRKPYKEDIGSHQLRSRVCRNSKIARVHHYESESTVIYLHICKICNFVNLNQLNFKNHIRNQHGLVSNELENSKKCILLVKDIPEIVKDIHPAGFEGNSREIELTLAEEDAPLCAEQDFLCELPMDIQNILMDENNMANGQEPQDKSKTIIGQKCDVSVQPNYDEPVACSPEALLEEMHAPNNAKNTTTRNVFSESICKSREKFENYIHAEENPIKSILDVYTSDEISGHNNKRMFNDLKVSETLTNNITAAQSSKKVKLTRELDVEMEKQNDSESLTSIEAYIKSTNKIHSPGGNNKSVVHRPREDHHGEQNLAEVPDSGSSSGDNNYCENLESLTSIEEYIKSTNKVHSPERHTTQDRGNSKSVVNRPREDHHGKQNLAEISDSGSSSNDNNYCEDLESLTSIEEYIKSTNKQNCHSSEKPVSVSKSPNKHPLNSPTEINVEESSESSMEESIEKHFEDFHEVYIKSTKKKLYQNSQKHIQELPHPENSMSIENNSNENLCKSPERVAEELNASKSSIQASSDSMEKTIDELRVSEHSLINRTTHTKVRNKILAQSSVEPEIEPSSPEYSHSMIYRQYDKLDLNNFGLFKCLIENCLYSTNSAEEFKVHCSNHNRTNILDCPYCFTKSSCLENVIHHIWHEHSMSNYQCVTCSYRSIVPGNVIIHRRICHKAAKAMTDESMYKCCYLKISEDNKYKDIPIKIRDNTASLKCPDCSYRFSDTASIKSHLQKSHPLTFQRFSSLNLNELACIQCKKVSNCKEMMEIHLALHHPDEAGFVIKRKLKPKDCENPVEGLMVVDISISVPETAIKILEDSSESHNIANTNEDQEALEAEPKQLETVTNSRASPISTVMPPDSLTKSSRLSDICTIDHQPGQKSSEASSSNSRTKSPLVEKNKKSSVKQRKMEETPQTEEAEELSGSIEHPTTREPQQNEQSQPLEDIVKIKNLHIHNLHTQSPNESHAPVQPAFIDNDQQDHHENIILEVSFETNSNFRAAVVKEGERIKLLLDLLVENTGIHSSTLYGCPHCNSSFMHFELWLTHMKNKHNSTDDVHCPYCTKQLQLDSAESHFKKHLRHEYICYYCIASCCSKKEIQEHFALYHENCNTIELPIASFYLVIKQDAIISDYTALLEHFAEAIYLLLTKKIQRNTINEWTAGLTDSCLDEMEIPKYKPEGQTLFKCFVNLCPFVGSDDNSLDSHLAEHELPKNFECIDCRFLVAYPSWQSIKCHHFQHLSPSLHVCCVCKFVHYNNDGMIKHIENLHNSRDVPVIYLLRDGLSFKVSISIFLPVNKISFTTSKACFCCAQEFSNSNKHIYHLKKVHELSLCPRCQLCGKIILTHLDGEAHYKEHHQMGSFKLKYEVLTTYLNNLILTSRSPLTMEIKLKNEECSDAQMESHRNECSSVAVKDEILVKSELEEDKQTQSISIKCMHTNQLLEIRPGKDPVTFEQHPHQSDGMEPNSSKQIQTIFVNRDVQHSTGGAIIENPSVSNDGQNLEPSTQHQQLVSTGITPQQHVHPSTTIQHSPPSTNAVFQYSSQEQAISNEVPLLSQAAFSHSTPTTVPRCSLPSSNYVCSLFTSQPQNKVTTETAPSCCILSIRERDSLPPRQTQHVVLQEIQLASGNAILSIPLEASTAEQQPAIVEELQRIPVITTRVAEPNIQPIASHPARMSLSPNITMPLPNISTQVNRANLNEIAPICGTCNFECIDFIHLQTHYEAMHANNNQGFYFYVDRKVGCMYCHFQGIVSSFAQHHATIHPHREKLCHSVINPIRCGICNDIFRYPPSSSANSYELSPLCACPGHQRTLADCLNLPILKTLQDIGYQYYKYSCDVCRLSFQSPQQFVHHYVSVHHQYVDPQLWRTKLKYYCCICPTMVSYNIVDIIYHMRFSHLITMSLPLLQKFQFYKRIRIAHPNGFLVSLDDLRKTGQFDEESFKQKIYNFEAQYVI